MQSKGLKIGLTLFRLLIAIIGIVLCVYIVTSASTEDDLMTSLEKFGGALDGALWLVFIVGILAAGAAILFGLVHFLGDIKHKIGSLVGILVFAGILLVSYYVLASDEVSAVYPEGTTPAISQFTGGGLMALYIIGALTILTVIFAEVSRIFK